MQLENRLEELYREEKKINKEEEKTTPKAIQCPQCGGVSGFSEYTCQFCGYIFKESDRMIPGREKSEDKSCQKAQTDTGILFVSFLLPFLGIILGLIYIIKNNDTLGKRLLVASAIGIMVATILYFIFASGTVQDIFGEGNQGVCHNCGSVLQKIPYKREVESIAVIIVI